MVFSSLIFICAFLPLFLLVYRSSAHRYKNFVALSFSVLFYSWGAPKFVFVLLISIVIDFFVSQRLSLLEKSDTNRKKLFIFVLFTNLGIFLYCKYMNFFVEQVNHLLSTGGFSAVKWTYVVLPIGISFFTFQKLSYLIDVYRGRVEPSKSLLNYALYVILFPQLIAGPIIRYHDVNKQLIERDHSGDMMFSGIWRFCLGLGKKVLIADVLGEVADMAFNTNISSLPVSSAWIGAFCYSFQIYFDFSGYSDMAIGLGRMMGFRFLENFNSPYISRNFIEFWRRWHISLTNWMREYLYLPLGGNRKSKIRTYFNLWLVFVISGFWHGAAWNFIVWGCYHGFFLTLNRITRSFKMQPLPAFISIPVTFLFVTFGWIIFRANDLSHAMRYLLTLTGLGESTTDSMLIPGTMMDYHALIILGFAIIISFAQVFGNMGSPLKKDLREYQPKSAKMVIGQFSVCCIILFASMMSLTTSSFHPFIYFKF